VTIPQQWFASAGEDAIWLGAFPKGAVLLSTSQAWFETRTAAQQPEPPLPFVAVDVQHVTLTRSGALGADATFVGEGRTLRVKRTPEGWLPADSGDGFAWFLREADGTPRRWVAAVSEVPSAVEGLRRETVTFPIR